MPYCAEADLGTMIPPSRLAQFAQETGTTLDVGGTAIVAAVCGEESRTIDRYLSSAGYVVPVTDPATLELLKPAAVTLVVRRFLGRRELGDGGSSTADAWEKVFEWLDAIARGKMKLPASAALIPTDSVPAPADAVEEYLEAGYGVAAVSGLSSSRAGAV